MDKYNWEAITYPSEKYYWKLFEKNDLKIAVKSLYAKIYIYIYIYIYVYISCLCFKI